jgi:hypothetical protein
MKIVWRICHRYYAARRRRAAKAVIAFEILSEKFYQRIKGVS